MIATSMSSFLARMQHASDPHHTERYTWRDSDMEAAIARHISQILSTRAGSSPACPDYGLIEVSEVLFDFQDAIGVMQRAIKNTIQQYEPRLKNVQVRHLKGEGETMALLEFEVTGQIQLSDGRRQSLRFATGVNGNGSVRVG
jgi:type VI secretion system protein